MKVNEAPENIYIFEEDLQREDHIVMYGINQDKDIRGLVEYTRTDAFIEKACDAYCKLCKMPNCRRNECKMIDNFKGHLKTI